MCVPPCAPPAPPSRQVRFVYEAFRKLRPGVPLRNLHGGMKQGKRTGVFYEFCEVRERARHTTHGTTCNLYIAV